MTLTSKPLAVLIVSILFGGILLSSALGWWQTENTKTAATYTEGEFAGQANPADIRGSYTLADIERNFGIPATVLAQAFGVSAAHPGEFQVKSLEAQYAGSPVEIGTASVRLFVAFYLGLPFDLSTAIYLPASAAELLQGRPLSAEQAAYLETHVAGEAAPAEPPAATPASPARPAPGAEATPEHAPQGGAGQPGQEGTVKGKTTFAELLTWGLTQEQIEAILGTAMPEDTSLKVKDFCTANGLDFEIVRPALQAALDVLK